MNQAEVHKRLSADDDVRKVFNENLQQINFVIKLEMAGNV